MLFCHRLVHSLIECKWHSLTQKCHYIQTWTLLRGGNPCIDPCLVVCDYVNEHVNVKLALSLRMIMA